MTLRLTPEILAGGYDFLRLTDPFRRWKLPESDDVQFHVIRDKAIYGDCNMDGTDYVIRVSEQMNGYTHTVLATIAHEMIHIRQFMGGDSANHNDMFGRLAKQVCNRHGFDPKSF